MTRAPLALKIAWRYFVAPKSHGAVNAISIISVVGVAVATAAIVIVLSVFNGFRFHLNARMDNLTPDISITPAHGKTFLSGELLVNEVSKVPGVEFAMQEVTDNALIIADSKEMPIVLKGVEPALFSKLTSIDSLLLDGNTLVEPKDASVSIGVAQRLGIYNTGESLFIFAPKRIGRVNMANPAASFISDSLKIASIFRSLQSEIDENTVICDISTARELLQYDTEATGVMIKVIPGEDVRKVAENLQSYLGDEFVVKDRFRQQEVNFRMVAIEKWITFTLLVFILLIASFNIISTLCMIILDKGSALHILSYLGLPRTKIGAIFRWESALVTLCGAGIGLILGVVVSLLQEKYGLIKLAGDPQSLVIHAYPVHVEWIDLGVTLIPLFVIGLITAFIGDSFAKSRLHRSF